MNNLKLHQVVKAILAVLFASCCATAHPHEPRLLDHPCKVPLGVLMNGSCSAYSEKLKILQSDPQDDSLFLEGYEAALGRIYSSIEGNRQFVRACVDGFGDDSDPTLAKLNGWEVRSEEEISFFNGYFTRFVDYRAFRENVPPSAIIGSFRSVLIKSVDRKVLGIKRAGGFSRFCAFLAAKLELGPSLRDEFHEDFTVLRSCSLPGLCVQ
jgi:hypothetical protein